MARLNWRKAHKIRPDRIEEKYDPGTVMKDGRVVQGPRPDSLAARAARAEREWLTRREEERRAKRAARRAAKQPPKRAELARLKAIRQQLS